MEVDATSTQPRVPFKKLTDEERLQHMQEGRCFRCRLKGHMARECPTRNTCPLTTNPRIRNTDTTSEDEQEDKIETTTATVQAIVNEPTLTRAQRIAVIEEEMSNKERATYLDSRDMEADFCSVEL